MLATLPSYRPQLMHQSLQSSLAATFQSVEKLPTPFFSMDTVMNVLLRCFQQFFNILLFCTFTSVLSSHRLSLETSNTILWEVGYRCMLVSKVRNWKCVHTWASGEIFRNRKLLLHFRGSFCMILIRVLENSSVYNVDLTPRGPRIHVFKMKSLIGHFVKKIV